MSDDLTYTSRFGGTEESDRANGQQELRQAWSDYNAASKSASEAWRMCHAARAERDAARAEVAQLKGLLREASIALDDAVEWLWRDEETVMSSRVRQLNGRINAALAEAPAAKEAGRYE